MRLGRPWRIDLQKRLEALRGVIERASDAIGNVDVPLSGDPRAALRKGIEVAQRVHAAKSDYVEMLNGEKSSIISSFSVEAVSQDFDFSFVEDQAIRAALEVRLGEAYESFRNRLHAMSAVAANSIIEALLIYALKQEDADAQIVFNNRFSEQPKGSHYTANIDRWNTYELTTVAQELGIAIDRTLFGLIKECSKARNGIHLYKLVKHSMPLGYPEAMLTFSVVHRTYHAVRDWLNERTTNESSI